jgi:general secretion pathway protein G
VIIMTLAGIAIGQYGRSVQRAREASLKQDLFVMRNAIQQYTLDKAAGPQSLDDLVSAGYLKQLPTDPMTGRSDTWAPDEETDTIISVDEQQGGIIDVHSGSSGVGSDGTAYNTW